MELLDRIKAALSQREWNDGEFARQLGMSQSVWSRIKNGKRPLDNVRFLRAVARVLPELRWYVTKHIIGGNKIGREQSHDKSETSAGSK